MPGEANDKLNSNSILILTTDGVHREPLSKVLSVEGFQVHYSSDLSEVVKMLTELKCGVFLHDWDRMEKTQSLALQQKLTKMDQFTSLARFVFATDIRPQILAMAVDCGIRRVISYSTSVLNLVSEIRMVQKADGSLDTVQAEFRKVINSTGKYSQKKIDDVIEEAYKKFPHDGHAALEYANLSFRRENYDQAEKLAKELLRKDQNNVRAMNVLSRTHMKRGNSKEAIKVLEQANMLSPQNTERLILLGDTFFGAGDTKKAASYYSEALTVDQGNPQASKGLATVKLSDGDANAALDLIKNSLSEDEAAGFFNNAAVMSATNGKIEESLKLYETALKALKSERLKPQVYYNIALALKRQGNFDEALKNLKRAIKIDPRFEKALRTREEVERIIMEKAEQKAS